MRKAILWAVAICGLAIAGAGMMDCRCKRRVEATFEDEPIRPHRFPLRVEADHMLNEAVLEHAVALFNRAAGCKLFEIGEPADVYIDLEAPPKHLDGTMDDCARQCDPEFHLACTCFGAQGWMVYYPTPATIDVDLWVVAHELSHVLALKHDPGRKNAVTRPDAHRGPADGAMLLVTTRDSDALRDAYCER